MDDPQFRSGPADVWALRDEAFPVTPRSPDREQGPQITSVVSCGCARRPCRCDEPEDVTYVQVDPSHLVPERYLSPAERAAWKASTDG